MTTGSNKPLALVRVIPLDTCFAAPLIQYGQLKRTDTTGVAFFLVSCLWSPNGLRSVGSFTRPRPIPTPISTCWYNISTRSNESQWCSQVACRRQYGQGKWASTRGHRLKEDYPVLIMRILLRVIE